MGDSAIRPLEPADLPVAAAVFERATRTGSTPAGLQKLLRRTALEDPWADPELPPLVIADPDGELAGLLLTCTRRVRFDGEPLRATAGSHVIVDPAAQGNAYGKALIERSWAAPKQLSFTDGATDRAAEMLERIGFTLLQLESLEWTSVLRPAAYWQQRGHLLGAAGRTLARGLDALLARTPLAGAARAPGLTDEPLTPELMLEHLEPLTAWARLRVDYDLPFLTWLFEQLADDHPQGKLEARLVRRDGAAIGWHISLIPPGGTAQAMQVVAAPADMGAVFGALIAHAYACGASAVSGRLEAPLLDAITARRTLLRRGGLVLARAKEPGMLAAIQDGAALFTRLDADWWIDPTGR